jgi:phage baseplate assembly protein gpV
VTTDLFARLLQFEERWNRMAPRFGLVFATVRELTDEGVILDYLSADLDAPSTPARVATLMAGADRGTYFRPEPGDEVVVGFEMGDLSRPVILGALWNDEHAPPSQADTDPSNNVRTIVSRAGHEITFDDTPGSGAIELKVATGGYRIRLDASGVTITTTDGPVAGSKIVLDGVRWGTHIHQTGTGVSGIPMQGPP